MKVALVYDRVNKWGGAERVLLSLQKLFPDAPLYTSVHDKKNAGWAKNFVIKTSFLQKIPFLRTKHEYIPFLMPLAFEQFTFDEYDLVISVTSEAAKGIITKPSTKHICYCLTPTRYLWSGYKEYFSNRVFRFIATPIVFYLQKWDLMAANRPDIYIAISKEVQKRIKKYYHHDSALIYPPAGITNAAPLPHKDDKGKYYLIVSRLSHFTKYKRIDIAIAACNTLGVPLKIIGEGSWMDELKEMSGSTVEFLGSVSDEKLGEYYSNCKALLFPGIEDLGLTVIEAQYYGSPVIAYRGGGALETIKEGKTGIFFDKQTKESLIAAIKKFETMHFPPQKCREQADVFGYDSFKENFYRLVNQHI